MMSPFSIWSWCSILELYSIHVSFDLGALHIRVWSGVAVAASGHNEICIHVLFGLGFGLHKSLVAWGLMYQRHQSLVGAHFSTCLSREMWFVTLMAYPWNSSGEKFPSALLYKVSISWVIKTFRRLLVGTTTLSWAHTAQTIPSLTSMACVYDTEMSCLWLISISIWFLFHPCLCSLSSWYRGKGVSFLWCDALLPSWLHH